MTEDRLKVRLQLFADPGQGGDSNAGSNDGGNSGDGGQRNAGDNGDAGKSDVKTFTQAEIDAMIEKRLARARKQWEAEQEEARKKEQMTAEERLKAEKEEAEQRAKAAQEAANRRIIQAEAKAQAFALGVRTERIEYALRLADLSNVEVDEEGNPDVEAIKQALETVLKDLPELKAGSAPAKSGGEFNGGQKPSKSASLFEAVQRYYTRT